MHLYHCLAYTKLQLRYNCEQLYDIHVECWNIWDLLSGTRLQTIYYIVNRVHSWYQSFIVSVNIRDRHNDQWYGQYANFVTSNDKAVVMPFQRRFSPVVEESLPSLIWGFFVRVFARNTLFHVNRLWCSWQSIVIISFVISITTFTVGGNRVNYYSPLHCSSHQKKELNIVSYFIPECQRIPCVKGCYQQRLIWRTKRHSMSCERH